MQVGSVATSSQGQDAIQIVEQTTAQETVTHRQIRAMPNQRDDCGGTPPPRHSWPEKKNLKLGDCLIYNIKAVISNTNDRIIAIHDTLRNLAAGFLER
jgi:hypothetical protein